MEHDTMAHEDQQDGSSVATRSDSLQILVVDDEPDLRELIEYNLRQGGHEVFSAGDGQGALEIAKSRLPDVIVLDVMMPGMSGIEVAQRLRSQTETSRIPILMLTAKAEESHELEGFESGADDYVTKPFSMSVLVARIKSLAKRTRPSASKGEGMSLGPVRIDLDEHQVLVEGKPVSFTITEFRLLATLVGSKGKVLSRPALISRAIGPGVTVTERTIDVHVTAIRKKLGDSASLISTVRGVGYRADDPK
jgi:two-component system phosphate regulon response regulator PhoB